jgi:hypothetical protein
MLKIRSSDMSKNLETYKNNMKDAGRLALTPFYIWSMFVFSDTRWGKFWFRFIGICSTPVLFILQIIAPIAAAAMALYETGKFGINELRDYFKAQPEVSNLSDKEVDIVLAEIAKEAEPEDKNNYQFQTLSALNKRMAETTEFKTGNDETNEHKTVLSQS